jgi:hypothetical protein
MGLCIPAFLGLHMEVDMEVTCTSGSNWMVAIQSLIHLKFYSTLMV